MVDTPNLATAPMPSPRQSSVAPKLGALASFRRHWPEYLMEAGLLGAFMVSACVFGALYEFPQSPVHQSIMSGFLRRLLMGVSMGLTAIAIIYSPWGKQSGAHINPSVTLTFFRLGKIKFWDAALLYDRPIYRRSVWRPSGRSVPGQTSFRSCGSIRRHRPWTARTMGGTGIRVRHRLRSDDAGTPRSRIIIASIVTPGCSPACWWLPISLSKLLFLG